jgi:teichuronic acid biosynthesis glycosyltransferase TuaG
MHAIDQISIGPLVSVIIPVFNGEDYITRAIDSVTSQGIENVEIIVIDDCSEDSTAQILSQLNDPRITILQNNKNLGVAYSRNIGLCHASGEWIQFLDADDYLLPEKLSQQLKESEDYEFIYCDWYYERLGNASLKPGISKLIANQPLINQLISSNPFPIHSPLIKRNVIQGRAFFTDAQSHEDWLFWFDIFLQDINVKHIPKKLCVYFKQAASRNSDRKRSILGDIQFLETIQLQAVGCDIRKLIDETIRQKCALLTSIFIIEGNQEKIKYYLNKSKPLNLLEKLDIMIAKNQKLQPFYGKFLGPRKIKRLFFEFFN